MTGPRVEGGSYSLRRIVAELAERHSGSRIGGAGEAAA
jgi:hypothetical protein